MPNIKPTVGRKVWYRAQPWDMWPREWLDHPWDATIIYVHSDTRVNVYVINPAGGTFVVPGCLLLQEGEEPDEPTEYCEWMPYQRGQAAKTEAAEDAAKMVALAAQKP